MHSDSQEDAKSNSDFDLDAAIASIESPEGGSSSSSSINFAIDNQRNVE
jgi:hypothetical protein